MQSELTATSSAVFSTGDPGAALQGNIIRLKVEVEPGRREDGTEDRGEEDKKEDGRLCVWKKQRSRRQKEEGDETSGLFTDSQLL